MWSPTCVWLAFLVHSQGKNVEILHAVEDLIKIIRAHPLDDHLERVNEEEVTKLKKHYNHFMYQVAQRVHFTSVVCIRCAVCYHLVIHHKFATMSIRKGYRRK